MTRPTKSKAIERLKRALDAIPELKQLSYESTKFENWQRNTRLTLANTFEDNSIYIQEFNEINYIPKKRQGESDHVFYPSLMDPSVHKRAYVRGLESAESLLKSILEAIEMDWTDNNQAQIPSSAQGNDRPSSNKVFVIHGRDEGTRELVARFLEKLGLKPVILQEQPSEGRTIIEKFEYHADARFAVALLTPDDAGTLQDGKNDLKPRARQNVIFELGFFIGKLGREGVCALTKGDVEIPSDYAGVVYIPLDESAGWKQKLFQELDAAGFQLDAKRAFQA